MNWVVVALSSGALGTFMAAIVAYIGTRRGLQSAQPKVDAEADNYQAEANRKNIQSQGDVIDRLTAEVHRQEDKIRRVDAHNAELERRLDDMETKLDVAAAQLREANEVIRQLREQNELLRQQNERLD